MKPFLTCYSQLSLLNPLRSRIKNSFCHKPYYLETGLLSLNLFTTWRANTFTPQCSRSASTANFPLKGFYRKQKSYLRTNLQTKFKTDLDRYAKRESKPFYPNPLSLPKSRNNPRNITPRNINSVLHVRKRVPLGTHVRTNILPSARAKQDVKQTILKEIRFKRATLDTPLCNAKGKYPSLPAPVPAKTNKILSFQRTGRTVEKNSVLPEKFINLLMANGEKDKARRCLTQALFSITTHCQKHNLQNNSPLETFTEKVFKQQSTESKPSTADSSHKKGFYGGKLPVKQKTFLNDSIPLSPKSKKNHSLYMQNNKLAKQKVNPGKPFNPLRDVGLVLLESRLDNLSNGRYSRTRKGKLYPSLKQGQGCISMGKGNSISRLNHIKRVEKRLLSKKRKGFFLFVKQKGKVVKSLKQTGNFKLPLSLPFCGKNFETTFPVFSFPGKREMQNPSVSLIRLSLKERFLIRRKGFASLALHKRVQQSYLCSNLLHLVRTNRLSRNKVDEKRDQKPVSLLSSAGTQTRREQIELVFQALRENLLPIKVPKYGNHTTTLSLDQQQIHFLPFLPYSALFNWRSKRLNPLFGFAKQSQRFLLELCKCIPNRSVKGTEKIRQNKIFGSLPLLSCFYSGRTFSFPFWFKTGFSITMKAGKENNPFSMAKENLSYKNDSLQQDTKLQTKGLNRFVADPQNDSHVHTKDKKKWNCFTQGIPPVAQKALSGENLTKSVHTRVLLKGIQRVQPTLEVRRVRKGRNTFQVPSVVKQKRGEKVGIKWIINSAKSRKRKYNQLFSESLANQLVQSFDRLGEARSKRNELLKVAESNRPFLRFRWW